MSVTIKLRGDTEANWQAANPVLADREVALSTDKLNFKVGDGATAWTSLGYWLPNDLASVITIAANNVGMGTTNPLRELHIESQVPHIRLSDSKAITNVEVISRLEWYRGNNDQRVGYIGFPSASNVSMYLVNDVGYIVINPSDGVLGIADNSPQSRLDISNGAIQIEEMTPPAAPAANNIRLYAKDNGSGKTQLVVKFSDGTETILATQP